jgi:hypothetical protein
MALTLSDMPARISFPGVLDYLSISSLPEDSSPGIKRTSIYRHTSCCPHTFTAYTGALLFSTLPSVTTATVHRLWDDNDDDNHTNLLLLLLKCWHDSRKSDYRDITQT